MAASGRTLAGLLERLWYAKSPVVKVLWPVGFVMGLIAQLRRQLYAWGIFRSFRIDATTIVVGNVTVGGTGKTPITLWLARRLADRGLQVGIVCSGYHGEARAWPQAVGPDSDPRLVGDEAVLLARQSGCPVAAGRDRVAAARSLIERNPVDVVLCDDGLQHYRLQRDVEILVVDGARALGNGMCLPAGPLREPAHRLDDVDAVVINDGNWDRAGAIHCDTVPVIARNLASGREAELTEFREGKVHAVAAIGNPERFFAALELNGIRIERHPLPDHAAIEPAMIRFDDDLPVLLTVKDAVKCPPPVAANVWSVVAAMRFRDRGDERLLEKIYHAAGMQVPS